MIYSFKQQLVQSQAEFIATRMEETFDALSVEDEERVIAVVSQLEVAGGMHIVITDASGIVLYDPAGLSEQYDYPLQYIIEALTGYDIFYSRFFDGAFNSSAFTPIMSQGAAIGAVYVHDEDTNQGEMLLEMQDTIRNISVLVGVFSVVTVTLILWSVVRRLSKIMSAIESCEGHQLTCSSLKPVSFHTDITNKLQNSILLDIFTL